MSLKNTILNITLLILLAVSTITILIVIAGGFSPINNGFSRRITSVIPVRLNVIKKPSIVSFIADITEKDIYFQTTNPGLLFYSDQKLHNLRLINFQLKKEDSTADLFYSFIDSNKMFFLSGNKGSVTHFDISAKKIVGYSYRLPVFTRAILIRPNTIVVRGVDTSGVKPDQIFYKINVATGFLQKENNISEEKGDAGIITDGLLHYDSKNKVLIYVYFFRNQFMCFDTSLNLKYKQQTIDKMDSFQIQAGNISSGAQQIYSNTKPSRIVNWESDIDSGNLYVNSWIKADNESLHMFNNNSVIDIYNIKDHSYKQSFYLPFYDGEKMESFKVYKNKIIAIYKNYIVVYTKPF